MIKQQFVYHCSRVNGLKELKPKSSTHNIPWVYATKEIVMSAMYMGYNDDFICQTGILKGVPYICERFDGAFEYAYKGYSGSIYYLKSDTFKENQTSWSPEVVSEVSVKVEKEEFVQDVYDFLLSFIKQEKLLLYRYPSHPEHIPKDKSDLVERAIMWTEGLDEGVLRKVKELHPDILPDVLEGLKKKGYLLKKNTDLGVTRLERATSTSRT